MVQRALAVLALAASTLVAGCATWYHVQPGNLPASSATIPPEQRSAVWNRAITVLLEQGYVPQVVNEAAAYISARRREDIENDAFARTIALFTISPDGHVRLEVSGAGMFSSERKFIAAIGQRQDQLLEQILGSSRNQRSPK